MAKWVFFHHFDPFIIHFTGNIGLRWYSMAYIAGFVLGYYLVYHWLVKTRTTCLLQKDWADQVVWSAFGVILGGRLGYALFYQPDLFINWDSAFPFWGLLKIHEGGLASHGGIAGLIVATWLFAKKRGFSFYHCLDLTSLVGGLGIFFGRWANFINGELYGRVIQNKALVAVQFPQEMLSWVFQKNTVALHQLHSLVSHVGVAETSWQSWLYQVESTGSLLATNRIYSVVLSLIKACENRHQALINGLQNILLHRHPSQIYQAFLEGLFPFILLWLLWRRKSLPAGWITVIFGFCYAVMRIVGEQFREPDTHIGFQLLGLTRGQWLSVCMLLAVLLYLILVLKAPKGKMWGGWSFIKK